MGLRAYMQDAVYTQTGTESQAVVEFAPYQRVPMDKKKPDARNATIEKGMPLSYHLHLTNGLIDEDYISFLESLTAEANREPVSLETLSELYTFLNEFDS